MSCFFLCPVWLHAVHIRTVVRSLQVELPPKSRSQASGWQGMCAQEANHIVLLEFCIQFEVKETSVRLCTQMLGERKDWLFYKRKNHTVHASVDGHTMAEPGTGTSAGASVVQRCTCTCSLSLPHQRIACTCEILSVRLSY